MNLKTAKTYIYIDVSNIRYACKWSSGFHINFDRLYTYLKQKYPNIQEIRYYEGISPTDKKKRKYFKTLEQKVGYTVCPLWRKSYSMPAKYQTFKCEKCGATNTIKVLNTVKKLKSNVDVYLTSDMLEQAAKSTGPTHIVLISCDGDYAEAIKAILRMKPEVNVSIIATPLKRKNNCLSKRLQIFADRSSDRTVLVNIESIKDYIS